MSDYGYCPSCGQPGVHRARGGLVTCIDGHRFSEADFVDAARRAPVKEQLIESYFVDAVKASGGEQRKVVFPGHPGAPDRWAGWPTGFNALVELKRPDGEPEAHQRREHDKLRRCGFRVEVLSTKQEVDAFIRIALSR